MAALIPTASASGSGTMTLAGPSTNSNQTITIPDATGTMMVSGNMPAFSTYLSGNQSITNNTSTKVQFNSEQFDTNNYFDSSTNYRFTPLIAGYYQINVNLFFTGTGMSNIQTYLYKNGSQYNQALVAVGISVNNLYVPISTVVYMNGSTDYLEVYGYLSAVSGNTIGGTLSNGSIFSGCLVRAA